MEFIELAELCDKGSSNLVQKDLVFDSGIYPVYGAPGEITKVDFFHQRKPYLGLIKDGAGVGRVMQLPANSSVIGTIQYIFPKENVDLKYLYYLIKYLDLGKSNTGATIPHIYFKDYKKRKVKVREYGKQKHIGQILELIDSHLSAYKNVLEQYDLLIKSRFVEMFGIFNVNTNNQNTIKFKDLIEQNNTNEDDLVWLLNLDMIKANTGEIVEKVYINRQNIPTSSISFKKGTVLYSKLRPYLNKVVIADENGYGTSELIPLNSYKNGLTAEYLAYYLRQDSFVEYIKDKVTGAKMPRVAMDVLRSIDIVQPNYVYQEQFSSFVYQINKLKSDVQKSIDETQLLMDSLMQEYFG